MAVYEMFCAIILLYMRVMLRRRRLILLHEFNRRQQECRLRRAARRRRWQEQILRRVRARRLRRAVILMLANAAYREGHMRNRTLWVKHRECNWYERTFLHPAYDEWVEDFRMNQACFNHLVEQLTPALQKQNTRFRQAVPARKRVAITLWRLATNDSYREVSKFFNVGRGTACVIFQETCRAIVDVLMPQYIRRPNEQRLRNIVHGFEQKWGYPMCAGAIDGTHIPIIGPEQDHTDYLNRKNVHSIILQGVCDDRYRFIDINVGWPGRVHDARVFVNSDIRTTGDGGRLFPDVSKNIQGVNIPPMIIGDPAYPLLNWLMKGFRDNGNLLPEQKLFNHILSRARMVIENTYGRLKGRWRCLLKRNDSDTEFMITVITACCVLHNMCEVHKQFFDPLWLQGIDERRVQLIGGMNAGQVNDADARDVRDALVQHFVRMFPGELQRFQ